MSMIQSMINIIKSKNRMPRHRNIRFTRTGVCDSACGYFLDCLSSIESTPYESSLITSSPKLMGLPNPLNQPTHVGLLL